MLIAKLYVTGNWLSISTSNTDYDHKIGEGVELPSGCICNGGGSAMAVGHATWKIVGIPKWLSWLI